MSMIICLVIATLCGIAGYFNTIHYGRKKYEEGFRAGYNLRAINTHYSSKD